MKLFVIFFAIAIIIIGGVFVWRSLKIDKTAKIKENSMSDDLKDKKIAMVIAFRDFQDEEYFVSRETLEGAGAEIAVVSSSLGKAIGKMGGEAEVNILIKDLKVADYDAVLFIGGPGAANYIDDETYHKIARETVENNKVLGAICIAPAILARAGVLAGKKATVWSSVMDKSAVKILKNSGAIYQPEPVVVDRKIITAAGPFAAKDFAEKIIEILK